MDEPSTSTGTPRPPKRANQSSNGNEPKKQKTDSSKGKWKTTKGGLKRSVYGPIYQSKLLAFFVLRAKPNKYDFRLATEMVDAGKLNDIVFKWKNTDSESWSWRFIQVKHIENEVDAKGKIQLTDFISKTGRFGLYKYFLSFCKIMTKKNIKKDFNDGKPLEEGFSEFSILTNTEFNPNITEEFKNWTTPNQLFMEEDDSENALKNDVILNSNHKDFTAKKYKFTKSALEFFAKFIKYLLCKNALDLFEYTDKAVEKLEEVRKTTKVKVLMLKVAQKVAQMRKILNSQTILFDDLDESIRNIDEIGLSISLIDVKRKIGNIKNNFEFIDKKTHLLKNFRELKIEINADEIDSNKDSKEGERENKKVPCLELKVIKMTFGNNLFDKNIKDFLAKFRFITNYPSKEKLSINIDLATNSFEQEMLSFLKRVDSGEEYFYSWKIADTFFNRLNTKINELMVSGLNSCYPEKLRSFGIQFKSQNLLDDFIKQTECQVLLISTVSTRLSAIKVQQSLDELKNKTNSESAYRDNYIFIRLKSLLLQKRQAFIMEAFRKKDNLFVIECQNKNRDNHKEECLIKELVPILQQNSYKKIIIIESGSIIAEIFENLSVDFSFQKKIDNSFFKDLAEESKEKILKMKVNFQGIIVTFGRIGKKFANKLFHDDRLLATFIEEDIKIGDNNEFCPYDFVKDYYITRYFEHLETNENEEDIKVTRHENYLIQTENIIRNRTIIIANDAGMGKSTVLTSIALKLNKRNEMKKDAIFWICRINLSDYAVSDEFPWSLHNIEFNETNIEKAIEFLIKMIYKNLQNTALQQKLLELSLKNFENVNQHFLKHQQPNIVIMFDGFDEINPEYKANTIKLIVALQNSGATQIYVASRTDERYHLEKKLNTNAHILLPLSGDEQRTFLNKFFVWNIKFAKYPAIYTSFLFIIPRTFEEMCHRLKQMESSNSTLRYIFLKNDFNFPSDYKKLIEKINNLDFSDYVSELFQHLDLNSFTDAPLHLQMLCDVVVSKNYQIHDNFNLLDLYDSFIKINFDNRVQIKAQASKDNSTLTILKDMPNISKCLERGVHCECAVRLLHPELSQDELMPGLTEINRYKKSLQNYSKAENDLPAIGLVALRNDRVQFLHRNYAEYFLSEYINEYLTYKRVRILLLMKILSQPDRKLSRFFLNGHLKNVNNINLEDSEKEILGQNIKSKRFSILRFIAKEGHDNIFEFLFKGIKKGDVLYDQLISSLKTCSKGITTLNLSIEHNNVDVAKKFLKYSLESPEILKSTFLEPNKNSSKTPLCRAALTADFEMVKMILEFVQTHFGSDYLTQFILTTDSEDKTVLHNAFENESDKSAILAINLLNWFRINVKDTLSKLILKVSRLRPTVLHSANKKNDSTIIMELLQSTSKEDLQDFVIISAYEDKNPEQFLDDLIAKTEEDNHINNVIKTLRSYSNEIVNAKSRLSAAILNSADVNRILNQSKAFLSQLFLAYNRINGWTVLHEAADEEESNIMEQILKTEISDKIFNELILTRSTDYRETALHLAAENGNNEFVTKMLDIVLRRDRKTCKNLLLGKNKHGATAIEAANKKFNDKLVAHRKSYRKTIVEMLKFEVKNMPEILEEQMKEIGGLRNDELYQFDQSDQEKLKPIQIRIDLFIALKNGKRKSLDNILFAAKQDESNLREMLFNELESESIISICKRKAIVTLLNWVNSNLNLDGPNNLQKLALYANEVQITNKKFLHWVKINVEKKFRGTLKSLLLKPTDYGKTALSSVIRKSNSTSKSYLDWLKKNLDEQTFKEVLLATDFNGESLLHSIANDSHLYCRKAIFDNILSLMTDNKILLWKLFLIENECEETALDIFVKLNKSKNIKEEIKIDLGSIIDKMEEVLHEIVTTFPEAPFDTKELEVLEHLIKYRYDKPDKKDILLRIRRKIYLIINQMSLSLG